MKVLKVNEKVFLTADQAESLLPDGENIHTFRNTSGALIGCDWHRESILSALKQHEKTIELTGHVATSMRHGIVINDGSALFIETDKIKLDDFNNSIEE